MDVFIMGIGLCGTYPASSGLSYREMIARAATMAYKDSGMAADEVDGAVSVEEDFISGYSISDEYVPDQIGMVYKPVYTICGDYLQGLASAVMQIRTGRFNTVIVESYSKASNLLDKDETLHFAYDPVFNRLGVSPHYLAGLEMQSFLKANKTYNANDVADFAARMRNNAVTNPNAAYGAQITSADVLGARQLAEPVTEEMVARHSDGAVCVVIGNAEAAKRASSTVCITGTGWGSGSSIIERRDHTVSVGTQLAAKTAFAEAGITSPEKDADLIYLSDLYAHRALMHAEALGISKDALQRVNPDGGSLGTGDLFEANSGMRLYDAVSQLRGQAGIGQVKDAKKAIVQGWRGLPTDSSAVVVLDAERGLS